jgi:hypothetical protein
MSQQWLSLAGVALDGAAFFLLLFEWWWALVTDSQLLAMERDIEKHHGNRQVAQTHLPPRMRVHLAMMEDWSDYIARRRANHDRFHTLSERKGAFLLAALLIIVGTALQILGTWPGCCQAWGIVPQA